MNFFRNLMFTIIILALIVGGVGYYLEWWRFSTGTDEHKANLHLTVNKDRIQADEERAKQAVENVGHKIKEKTEEFVGRGHPTGKLPEGFQTDIETRLKEIDARIGDLQAKVARQEAPKKEELSRNLDQLNQKRREITRKLEELKTAAGKKVDEIKAEIETEFQELRKDYDKLAARFE